MARSRSSARKAGSEFEWCVAAFLRIAVGDERIERRARNGAKDRGDLTGLMVRGRRVVAECKDYAGRERMPSWLGEAERERGNDDAEVGVVISHARGVGVDRGRLERMAGQTVTMSLLDFAVMLLGDRAEAIGNIERYVEERERRGGAPDEGDARAALLDELMGRPVEELEEIVRSIRDVG